MSWFDWVPAIVMGAADIYGNQTKNAANTQAAQIATAAQQQAQQQEVAGLNQSIGTYDASKTNDQALQQQGAPGVAQQQTAIAQQNTLTPAQQLAIDQQRQLETQNLSASGLAGSGRANVAAQNYLTQNTTANFMNQNRARADSAAGALSGQYFSAGQNINTQNANIAGAQQKIGAVQGGATNEIGGIQAGNVTANAGNNAQLAGQIGAVAGDAASGTAINDIGSQISAANKARSAYSNPVGAATNGNNQRL